MVADHHRAPLGVDQAVELPGPGDDATGGPGDDATGGATGQTKKAPLPGSLKDDGVGHCALHVVDWKQIVSQPNITQAACSTVQQTG